MLEIQNPTITQLEHNCFRFEYDDGDKAKDLKSLKEFNLNDTIYEVKKKYPCVEIPGIYYSYIVII